MDFVAFNIALIIILGIVISRVFDKFKVPGFIGVIFLGIFLGPSFLNIIDPTFLGISSDLGSIALVIILLRAGLGLNRESLRKAGIAAIEMSCIPSIFEGLTVMFVASYLLGIPLIEAGMLGFVLGSVAPAVLVPPLLDFIKREKGTAKAIPALLMAGASADDVVAITLFSVFLGMYIGGSTNIALTLFGIPVSLVLGIILGFLAGIFIVKVFERFKLSHVDKILLTLSIAILLNSFGQFSEEAIPVAGLLGVMVLGFYIIDKEPGTGFDLSNAFSSIWVLAEILIFAMIGIQLNIDIAFKFLPIGLLIIAIGLLGRYLGIFISLLGKDLTKNERLFCMIAYTPKASAQAAIGAIPLAVGVPSGEIILAISVIAILVTAPIGAIGIKVFGEKVLSDDSTPHNSSSESSNELVS